MSSTSGHTCYEGPPNLPTPALPSMSSNAERSIKSAPPIRTWRAHNSGWAHRRGPARCHCQRVDRNCHCGLDVIKSSRCRLVASVGTGHRHGPRAHTVRARPVTALRSGSATLCRRPTGDASTSAAGLASCPAAVTASAGPTGRLPDHHAPRPVITHDDDPLSQHALARWPAARVEATDTSRGHGSTPTPLYCTGSPTNAGCSRVPTGHSQALAHPQLPQLRTGR